MLIAGPALAQNPGADQYTPTAPSGGGPTPTTDPSQPSTSSAPGSHAVSDPTTAPSTAATTPQETAPATTGDPTANRAHGPKRNGDQRTLAGIASSAKQELSADQDKAAAARLLRDDGSDSGLGIFFWVVLAATVLWALLTAISRRRNDGDSDSSGRRPGRLGSRNAA